MVCEHLYNKVHMGVYNYSDRITTVLYNGRAVPIYILSV